MIRLSELPMGFEFGCTTGFGGTDSRGVGVAVTAGHCAPARLGVPAYLGDSPTPAGQVIARSALGSLDYVAVRLRPGIRVQSVPLGPRPHVGDVVCKTGRMTGTTCGPVKAVTPTRIIAALRVAWGDSGGLLRDSQGRSVGMVSAGDRQALPLDPFLAEATFVGSMVGVIAPIDAVFIRTDVLVDALSKEIGFQAAV